jgi:hypothetical protein
VELILGISTQELVQGIATTPDIFDEIQQK